MRNTPAKRRRPAAAEPEQSPYPAVRAFRTQVARTQRITPHFLRVTLTGDQLRNFGPSPAAHTVPGARTGGAPAWDQRIKLFLPRADGSLPEIGLLDEPAPPVSQWYTAWRMLDEQERNPIRTYTVRQIRPEVPEVDIDFVLHAEQGPQQPGPAEAWAAAAEPGRELIIIGPDRRSAVPDGGIDFTPGTARDLLLAGDETAVPAICAVLEALPEQYTGHAYLEVPAAEDILAVRTHSGVEVQWLPRAGAEHGALLSDRVRRWGARRAEIFAARRAQWTPGAPVGAPATGVQDLPEVDEQAVLWETSEPEGFVEYAWLAGEAGVITALRRHLVKEVGLSRHQVSFMGYWRRGRPGA